MKLEFLAAGSEDRPLIRLYDFDLVAARRLREAFRSLALGSVQILPLHEECWIEAVEVCALDLRLGTRDLGLVERTPSRFDCILTADGWTDMASLTNPFCEFEKTESCTWLNQNGEISLLLTPSGRW
ncbi:MAG: hypothetical protein WA655_10515 [Candidatus Korobacteraceae bacterium]